MSQELSVTERAKFTILAEGIRVSPEADGVFRETVGTDAMTPADYASTTGLILRLEDEVWVNAPISEYNANFVDDAPFVLWHDEDGFSLRSDSVELPAGVWVPPEYHGRPSSSGRPLNHFVFTHGDRVRMSPMQGCAMTCKFCNIPFEGVPYGTKPEELMVEGIRTALEDGRQPAYHLLISGGTPKPGEVEFLAGVYERILTEFQGLEVDIMMSPVDGLLDLERLRKLGLHELSINLEVFNRGVARKYMRQKYQQGRQFYLDFIDRSVGQFPGHVRSMLMVGLEPEEDTLEGVRSLLQRGCTPVLSPFRPDPATPLRSLAPPTADTLRRVFLQATELAEAADIPLGPTCPPCTHNTLTLVRHGSFRHAPPRLI